jgi:acetyl esterase/lipase/ketosteroid isomerase-like protein
MSPNSTTTTGAIRVERDVRYGEGAIGFGTDRPGLRPLLMDVYLPAGEVPAGGRPALVMSHGGAYHRGAKDRDEFEQGGSHNTPVHEYCERFAARGYACFSIGYRLTQEAPPPLERPIKRDRLSVPHRERTDYVRNLLGLPPASDAELVRGIEATWDDVARAFGFIHAYAQRWGIDRDRMAIGGFSAGAVASAYSAFALGVPAAAVICLSGGMNPEDAEYYVHGGRGLPPVLLFTAEHDLPSTPPRAKALEIAVARVGLGVRHYRVPGKPHFYDRESPVELQASTMPGGERSTTVEAAIESFLTESLASPTVSVDRLEAFAQAWSRHDIDALMACMADDCVFHAGIGPEASGTRYVGRDAVRAGFVKAWTDFPDAQWTRARHFVAGRRGVSEWTFVGTRASDGVRVEVDGCDLFTFQGDRIRVKDSWRKQRTPPASG